MAAPIGQSSVSGGRAALENFAAADCVFFNVPDEVWNARAISHVPMKDVADAIAVLACENRL